MALTRDSILAALKGVSDPISGSDIVSAGIMRGLNVDGDTVRFVMEIDPAKAETYTPIRDAAEAAARAAGASQVSAVLTAHQAKAPPPDLKPQKKSEPQGPQPVPGVANLIAIASGKGGVGKSTVSANLACALAAEGRRVGLLDADVYGPSQPRMLGVSGRPASPDGKTILPLRNHGVTMMSMGLMTNEDQAVVWRGPMLMGALQQMLMQVQWGALDCLLVDLPPGTGDVQMTLAQKAQVTGAVVVSTPQDVALLDARKGIDMFNQLHVPILGMIENMSTHICSNCGHEEHVFGHGGVRDEAAKLEVPLLAEIPLDLNIRLAADGGAPIVVSQPDSPQSTAFREVARTLIEQGGSMNDPAFPPLMSGQAVTGGIDPFEKACAMATLGCDAGLIVHNITANRLMAAMVLAPEVPLEEAMVMWPACGIGFQNALGALAPPEVAVHLEWSGSIRVNGALCGDLRAAAGGSDPSEVPGWLVIGLNLTLMQVTDAPGQTPDHTALYDEGCVEVDPTALLESWARHTLSWITRWEEDGTAPLHAEWRGLAHGIGEDITQGDLCGVWLGVDECFGMLLRDDTTTHLIPLSSQLETPT